ncbi:MAG TPA: hypothetical protein VJH34_02205 [archaeon]|nr:hypothetical protein [archaeon]
MPTTYPYDEIDVFIIMPVRGITDDERKYIDSHIENLKQQGKKVYVPLYHTDQNDPIGFRICTDNMNAIRDAKEVHIYFNPDSQGTLFDTGMMFALGKPLRLINREYVKPTPTKSFANVLLALDEKYKGQ